MERLKRQLQLINTKYEKLGIQTPDYDFLKKVIYDEVWLKNATSIISKVGGLEKVFNISKEINAAKNDQRLSEAFAEFDTADRLVNTKFFGDYETLAYLPPDKQVRRPDFVARKSDEIIPIEVKLLSPSDLDESKFFQKFLDKINDHALPQLISYRKESDFSRSYIFVWSHQPVRLENLDYWELRKWLEEKVVRPGFDVTIMCLLYGRGIWDFPLKAAVSNS